MPINRFDIIEENGRKLTLAFRIGRDGASGKTTLSFGHSYGRNQIDAEPILIDKSPEEVIRALRHALDASEAALRPG
jgi:hypothetical protein